LGGPASTLHCHPVAVLIFGLIGLGIPLAILLAKATITGGFSSAWIYFVWPSYFILGGLSGTTDTTVLVYLAASIAINVGLYA
jgi:hypothetical protein